MAHVRAPDRPPLNANPAMKLWLLCFVLIFAAAEGLQGLSGWPNWLPSFAPTSAWHPLTVLAGLGLAVLSNAAALGLGSSPSPPTPPGKLLSNHPASIPPPLPTSAPDSVATQAQATQAQATQAQVTQPKPARTQPRAKPKAKPQAKADSISFEICKSSPPESPQS